MDTGELLNIALVGCGAISELYYAPALKTLAKPEGLRVAALVDPSTTRLAVLSEHFSKAQRYHSLDALPQSGIDLALVASPPRFHAPQTIAILERKSHVLCEKPMALTVAEAESMNAAAHRAERHLGIGLFRRFFPTSQYIYELVTTGVLGPPLFFQWLEGGSFNWPATSPSFFHKSAHGGVLADLGVHGVDLMLWWFGDPESFVYEDDAHGGSEANCRLELVFPSGLSGKMRFSRDTSIPNHVFIAFERGWVRVDGVQATEISIGFNGVDNVARSQLHALREKNPGFAPLQPAPNYTQCFMRQVQNMARAIRGTENVFAPGEEGLRSVRWIEAFYKERRVMAQPWL